MNLYVLRHGLAADPGAPGFGRDAERPLTPKGKRKLRKIADAMLELDLCFDLILSSPYLRARQTAEIVAKAFKARNELDLSDHLTPSGSLKKLIDFLNDYKPRPENVLLVGHEPYLSELISLLVSGDKNSSVQMKKGGLCKLSVNLLKHGRCSCLEWLLTPKQMRLMA